MYLGCPEDNTFWYMPDIGLKNPDYFLPTPTEKLYVLKPIGHYKPVKHLEPGLFKPDVNKIYNRKHPSTYKNFTIKR